MPPTRRGGCLELTLQTQHLKSTLQNSNYAPSTRLIEKYLLGVNFASGASVLKQKEKNHKRILSFVTTYHPAVQNLKQIVKENWNISHC